MKDGQQDARKLELGMINASIPNRSSKWLQTGVRLPRSSTTSARLGSAGQKRSEGLEREPAAPTFCMAAPAYQVALAATASSPAFNLSLAVQEYPLNLRSAFGYHGPSSVLFLSLLT